MTFSNYHTGSAMDSTACAVNELGNSDTNFQPSKKKQNRVQKKKTSEDSDTKKIGKIDAHRKSICERAKIQELVDFASQRLTLHEMHLSPFTTNHFVSEHFILISMDGAPLTNMALCKKCKTVLVRFRKGTTNLKVHQQRHLKPSLEVKTTKVKNVQTQDGNDPPPAPKKKRNFSKKKMSEPKIETSEEIKLL